MPRVSTIIPTFNRATLVGDAIRSALSQTYHDLEVIVVNDGSTDDTIEVLGRYQSDRLVCIHQRNQGLARARNAAIEASRGIYIAFLDDDDIWYPNKIELQVRAFREDPEVDLVYGAAYMVSGASRTLVFTEDPPEPGALLERLIEWNIVGNPSVVMVKADTLRRAGLFDPTVGPYSDWDLWLRLARRGGRFAHVREPIAEYRLHGNNMVNNSEAMSAGLIVMMEKFFSDSETPVHLKVKRSRVLSRALIRTGMDHYIALRFTRAWKAWGRAARLDPSVVTPHLISLMAKSLFGARVLGWARQTKRALAGAKSA